MDRLSVLLLFSCVVLAVLPAARADSVHFRDVRVWVMDCKLPACNVIKTLFGAINMGAFESFQAGYAPGDAKAKLLASFVSTYGLPTITMMYYKSAAQWKLPNNWKDWGHLFDNSSSFPRFGLGAVEHALGYAVESLVEYKDLNGNGQYDPGTNETVGHYRFFPLRRWKQMTVHNESLPGGNTMYVFNVTTHDNVFSMQFRIATDQQFANGTMTPKRVKIDVEVKDYPFKQNDTSLALSAFSFSSTGRFRVKGSGEVELGDGYLSWVDKADASVEINGTLHGVDMDVRASNVFEVDEEDLGPLRLSAFNMVTRGQFEVDVKKQYYSFHSAHGQPKHLYWDPAVGYQNPSSGNTLSPAQKTGVIVGVVAAVVAVTAAVVYFRRRKTHTDPEAQPLAQDRDSTTYV